MNNDPFEIQYKSYVVEILPNTKRTQQLRDQQLAEQRRKKEEAQQQMRKIEEQAQKLKKYNQQKEQQKQLEEQRRIQQQRRELQERQQISTLKGKFGNMINSLQTNDTTLDYTITGLDLHPAHVRIMVKAVETNESLRGLILTRKNLQDSEGIEIANNLKKNNVLQRIELEGNRLGPRALQMFSELLQINTSLRCIDFEGNQLCSAEAGKDPQVVNQQKTHKTNSNSNVKGNNPKEMSQPQVNLNDGTQEQQEKRDNSGVEALAKALKNNDTLLYLNLSNNNLDRECGQYLLQMLEHNFTLVSLDLFNNPKMNLHDIRKIQDFLKRNQQMYDDQRYREFIERKRKWNEEHISEILAIREEGKRVAQENINIRIQAQKQQMDEDWEQQLQDLEIQRQKEIARLEKEAKQQQQKGRRGSPKKK